MPPLVWGPSMGSMPDRLAEPPENTEERKGSSRDAGPVLELMRLESLLLRELTSSVVMEAVGLRFVMDICAGKML